MPKSRQAAPPPTLSTPSLDLVACDLHLIRAEMRDRAALAQALPAQVPENWPPELMLDALPWFSESLERQPSLAGWLCWYWLRREPDQLRRVLVGSGGFRGCPDQEGCLECGYSLLPQFQGRGLALEAMRALVEWAFGHDGVGRLVAETYPVLHPSVRLLARLGFDRAGQGRDPGSLRYELPRPALRQTPAA